MERDDRYFMREALKEALKAKEMGEVPIGAVLVAGERVVARAHNMVERLNDATAHAEMLAITSAANSLGGKYLEGLTLYVTLEPCPMCASALNLSHITKICYGARDPKRGYSLFSPSLLHPKCEVIDSILEEESAQLLFNFFKEKR